MTGQLHATDPSVNRSRPYFQRFVLSLILGVVFTACVAQNAHSQATEIPESDIHVDNPLRAFGYVLGDILVQRVLLPPDAHWEELEAQLPMQRTGPWLERQSVSIEDVDDERKWLVVSYQIVNSPTTLTHGFLSALSLEVSPDTTVEIEPWSFTLGPITAPDVGENAFMQPDRVLPPVDAEPIARRLSQTGLILVVLLAAWLGWWLWRERKDSVRLPFARAYAQLKKIDTHDLGKSSQAWTVAHRAFNQTAGHVLHSHAVDDLITKEYWLLPFTARIEAFYAASDARFYEQPPRDETFPLYAFVNDLYQAEKRNAL